jgi:hypothetical protein
MGFEIKQGWTELDLFDNVGGSKKELCIYVRFFGDLYTGLSHSGMARVCLCKVCV